MTIMTDHMNLTHDDIQSTRLLNWRLLIEEFAPTLTYVKGIDNTGSDFLSRYPLEEEKPTPWPSVEAKVQRMLCTDELKKSLRTKM